MTTKKSTRTTVNSVANALNTHEQVCAERWKHAYQRFDRIEELVKTNSTRLWWFAGIVISLLMSLVIKTFI
jgi:hypothetical protein